MRISQALQDPQFVSRVSGSIHIGNDKIDRTSDLPVATGMYFLTFVYRGDDLLIKFSVGTYADTREGKLMDEGKVNACATSCLDTTYNISEINRWL